MQEHTTSLLSKAGGYGSPPTPLIGRAMDQSEACDSLIDAGTTSLGISVDPAWHPAIRSNPKVTLRLAVQVIAAPWRADLINRTAWHQEQMGVCRA